MDRHDFASLSIFGIEPPRKLDLKSRVTFDTQLIWPSRHLMRASKPAIILNNTNQNNSNDIVSTIPHRQRLFAFICLNP